MPKAIGKAGKKFVPRISECADSLAPELSETRQADELFVN
jgi:hypothetical protein